MRRTFTGCTSTYYKITQLNGNVHELERISLFQKLDVSVKVPDGFEIKYTNDGGVEITQRVVESAVTAAIRASGVVK